MTKLYKTTGIEYEIEYPPPPEPPPPAPDPQTPTPPKDKVDSDDSPEGGDKPVDRSKGVVFVSCFTAAGLKGVQIFIDGNPSGPCMKSDYQGLGS